MSGNFKIESKFNRNEIIEIIDLYLKENGRINLELDSSNGTYYIKNTTKSIYRSKNHLDFFMIQFTIKETPNNTILVMTPQSGMISLLMKVLILPLIWIFVFVFSFNKDYSYLNKPLMFLGGMTITILLLLIERKAKRRESNILNDLKSRLESIEQN